MEIKNLKKSAERILRAVKKKEPIIIYSDSDLDGVVSALIMQEAIQTLGGKIADVYFPNREKYGYGISEKALYDLKKFAPALLIAADLGISNVEEVKIADKMGFEVIIIDHHEVLDKVPKPAIVVDPKQKGDKYPFKEFSASGLVFKVVQKALNKKMGKALKKSFLELTAIATIADMMPQKQDNIELIAEGLNSIESTWRPGLNALLKIENSNSNNLMQKIYKINSLLNTRDIESKTPLAFRILSAGSIEEAQELSAGLIEINIKRKEKIEKTREELEKKIVFKNEPIIFEGDSEWDWSVLGTLASIISQKYQKPTFLYKEYKDESQGGVRASSGANVVEAMKQCSKYLITFGGHPKAAGFRLKNKNLENFKKCLIKFFAN